MKPVIYIVGVFRVVERDINSDLLCLVLVANNFKMIQRFEPVDHHPYQHYLASTVVFIRHSVDNVVSDSTAE